MSDEVLKGGVPLPKGAQGLNLAEPAPAAAVPPQIPTDPMKTQGVADFAAVIPGTSTPLPPGASTYRALDVDYEAFAAKVKDSPDPTNELAKVRASVMMARRLNMSPYQVYENFDTVSEQYIGAKTVPMDVLQTLNSSWETGVWTYEQGKIGADLYRAIQSGEDYTELLARLEEHAQKQPTQDPTGRALPVKALKYALESLPYMIEPMVVGGTVSLVSAGLGTGVVLPAAAQKIAQVAGLGRRFATFATSFENLRGMAMVDLFQLQDKEGNRIDPKAAATSASSLAFLQALIESSQIEGLMPGGATMTRRLVDRVAGKMIGAGTLADVAIRSLGSYAKEVGGETLEELLQEILAVTHENVLKEAANMGGADFDLDSFDQIAGRLANTVGQAFLASAVLVGPRAVGEMAGGRAEAAGTPAERATREAVARGGGEAVAEATDIRPIAEVEAEYKQLMAELHDNPTEDGIRRLMGLGQEIDRLQTEKLAELSPEGERQAWQMTKDEWRSREAPAPVDPRVFEDSPLRRTIAENLPNLSEEEVEGAALLVDIRAHRLGLSTEEYVGQTFAEGVFATEEQVATLPQTTPEGQPVKGAVQFQEDGKALFYATTNSDFSTWVHEVGHIFRGQMDPAERLMAEQAFGVEGSQWTETQEEEFARSFEAYLRNGQAPTPQLRTLFQMFAQWLKRIYQGVLGKWEVDERIRAVFDSMLVDQSSPLSTTPTAPRLLAQALPEKFPTKEKIPAQKPVQPTQDIGKVYDLVQEAKPDFDQWAAGYQQQFGGDLVARRELKSQQRVEQKVRAEAAAAQLDRLPYETILDIDGKTLIVDSLADIPDILEALLADPRVERVKNRFAKPTPDGYMDLLVNVRQPNGSVAELLVTTKQLLDVKHTMGHGFYEVVREVEEAVGDGRLEEGDEMGLMIEQLKDIQRRLYSEAYDASLRGDANWNASALDISDSFVSISAALRATGAESILSDRTRKTFSRLRSTAYGRPSLSTNTTRSGITPPGPSISPPTTGAPLFQVGPVFHGTPYQFEQFSTEHIGSGEGAQSFGWGLYFTDQKSIAEHYAKTLAQSHSGGDNILFAIGDKTYGHNELHSQGLGSIEVMLSGAVTTGQSVSGGYAAVRLRGQLQVLMEKDAAFRADFQAELDGYRVHGTDPKAIEIYENGLEIVERRLAFAQELYENLEDPGFTIEKKIRPHRSIYLATLWKEGQENTLDWYEKPRPEQQQAIREQLEKENIADLAANSALYRWLKDEDYLATVTEDAPEAQTRAFERTGQTVVADVPAEQIRQEWERQRNKVLAIPELETRELYQDIGRYVYRAENPSRPLAGTDKELKKLATAFLSRAGFDGIRYPTNSLAGNRDGGRGYNYVVFDAEAITTEEHILFQTDPHEEQVRSAVERGDAVPREVLEGYRGSEWAEQELEFRDSLRDDARGIGSAEEFAEFAQAMAFDQDRPFPYWDLVYSEARATERTRSEGNRRFMESMTKAGLTTAIGALADANMLEDVHPIIKAGALRVRDGKKISDAHYKKMLDQVNAEPARYREIFAMAEEDYEAAQALKEEEVDPLTARLEDVLEQNRQLKNRAEALKKTTGVLNDEVVNTRARLQRTQRELAELDRMSDAELRDFVKSARAEARGGAKVLRAQLKAEKAEAVKALREQLRGFYIEREQRRKLIRQITRRPGGTIAWEQAQQVIKLQSQYTTVGKARTIEARELARKAISQIAGPGSGVTVSEGLQAEANRRHVSELTLAELESVAKEISDLKKAGREAFDQQQLEERELVGAARAQIITALGGEVDRPTDVGSVEVTGEKKTGVLRKIQANTLRMDRLAQVLDGDTKGASYQWLVNEVNKAVDQDLRERDRRIDEGDAKMKELGITHQLLARELTAKNGKTYTADAALSMYIGLQNPDSEAALLYGNQISYETMTSLIEQLTDEEIQWAQFMLEDFNNPETFERLQKAVVWDTNRGMERVQRYFPMLRQDVHHEKLMSDVASELVGRTGLRRSYPWKGFSKSRIKMRAENQLPIRLGATAIWAEQVVKQEHYASHAQAIKRLHRIFASKDVRRAIEAKFGNDFNQVVEKYINDVAHPDIYKTFDAVSNLSRTLRQHAAVSYLAFNALTVLKQLPSLAFYMTEASPLRLLSAVGQFTANPSETLRFVNEHDPQMRNRTLNRFSEELKAAGGNAYERFVRSVGKIGMQPIYWMDKFATTVGWKAVYDSQIAKGATEQEATRAAQEATLRTQPAARAKDVAAIYRSNEGLNWFLMFTNQLNQIWNMTTYDIPSQVKRGEIGSAVMGMTAIAVSALAIGAITRRRPAKDAKEVGKDLVLQLISSVPVVGGSIKGGMEGWFGTSVDPVPVATEVGRLARALTGETTSEAKLRAVTRLLQEGMVSAGLPTVATRRLYRTFFEDSLKNPRIDAWELVGGRPEE